MPNLRNRKRSSAGSGPGITPSDDIHGATTTRDMEPSPHTGRMPAQDDDSQHKAQGRPSSRKKSARKTSNGG